MIGRSGSSAGSWVAASQSLRIGRWRWGAALDDCMSSSRGPKVSSSLRWASGERHDFDRGSDLRQHLLPEGAHLGDDRGLVRAFEIEIDCGHAKVFEGVNVADDVGVATGKEPALAVRGAVGKIVAVALDAV